MLAGVNPRLISTQLDAADQLFAAGRYDDAIAAYRKIRTQAPALTAVSLQIGNAYLQKKDYDRAEAEFQEVLKSDAANGSACYNLGDVKAARGAVGRGDGVVREGRGGGSALDQAADEAGGNRPGRREPRGRDRPPQESRRDGPGLRRRGPGGVAARAAWPRD